MFFDRFFRWVTHSPLRVLTTAVHPGSIQYETRTPWVGVHRSTGLEGSVQEPVRGEVLKRLRFIEGHLEGVRRMIE